MKKDILLTIVRTLLLLLFVYTGAGKIIAPTAFAHDLFNQPLPQWFSAILLFLVPAAEIGLALLLIPEKTSSLALKGSAVLMGLFTLYVAAILVHLFTYVPCSCTGFIKSLSWQQHLLFNLFFLLVAITGVLLTGKKDTISPSV